MCPPDTCNRIKLDVMSSHGSMLWLWLQRSRNCQLSIVLTATITFSIGKIRPHSHSGFALRERVPVRRIPISMLHWACYCISSPSSALSIRLLPLLRDARLTRPVKMDIYRGADILLRSRYPLVSSTCSLSRPTTDCINERAAS